MGWGLTPSVEGADTIMCFYKKGQRGVLKNSKGLMWIINAVLGSVRLSKGAVKRRTVGGSERHRKGSLRKC